MIYMKNFGVGKMKLENVDYNGKPVLKMTLLNRNGATLVEVIITVDDYNKLEADADSELDLAESSCLYKLFG